MKPIIIPPSQKPEDVDTESKHVETLIKPIWLELVNTGVANRFEEEDRELIEINWRLTKYPELYQRVFLHEMGHNNGDYKSGDLIHDMKSQTPGLFTFMSKHISSWTQLFPIYWDKNRKTIVYDWSAIVSWVLFFATAYLIYWGLGLIL